ncbi:MAG: response regulator [Verrucomicrobiota bacterium]
MDNAASIANHRARVLVVDDERIVAQDVSECLENMDCLVVETALSGPEAIQKARDLRPDLIMMDVVLQGDMDGIQAAGIIREELDTSCVFLTAYSDPEMLDRAKFTNPAGYIVKPFEEASLRATVEIALYKVAAEKELREHRHRLEDLVRQRTGEIQQRNEQLRGEVSTRRKTEKALEYRANMQDLVSRISGEFLTHKPAAMGVALDKALAHLADFFSADSAFAFECTEDGKALSLTSLLCREDSAQRLMRQTFRELHTASYPWVKYQLNASEVLYIESPEKLPPEALNERELLLKHGLKTILAVPIKEGGRVAGCLGLHVLSPARPWVREDITCLQMCSDVVLNAMNRMHSESEKENLQEQLAQSQKMEAVGKLSGGIAHDFNNMLLPIIGYTDMLLTTMEENDPRNHDLEEIRKAAERAASLTRQLLAFSKKQVIAKTVFNLNEAITSMENMLTRLIGEDVNFQIQLDDSLRTVRADRGQIEQVLLNLVVNARDAMPQGGGITVRTGNIEADNARLSLISEDNPRGNYVYIEVADTGCGMDQELMQSIFDPFYTTKGLDGTGLGLSVVYGILEQHNGGVVVDSVIGNGSVFTVFLPATAESVAPEPDQQNSMALTAPTRSTSARDLRRGEGERILLVEDEAGVSRFVSEALRKNGYNVLTAMNLREARSVFHAEGGNFDMVFSDAVLPDGNGLQLLDEVLNSHPHIRTLLSSGYTDKHAVLEILKQRPVSFLQKPYSLPKLISTVSSLLQNEEREPLVLTAED